MPLRRAFNKDLAGVLLAAGCWITLWTWLNLQLLQSLNIFV
ncbi:hypothetical protein [Rheinheimera maricola]|nr:hypothetical protein [Rheinheimera maricola]